MEKSIVKKAEGIQTDDGNDAGETMGGEWYSVLNAFDPDLELTGFIAGEAIKDCGGDYKLLESFLEWKDKTGLGNGEFKDINVDTLAEVTTPFMNVGLRLPPAGILRPLKRNPPPEIRGSYSPINFPA